MSLNLPLSLIEFPSRVIAIDDNEDFLKSLRVLGERNGIEIITFNDPKQALEYLKNYKFGSYLNEIIDLKPENNEIFKKIIQINLRNLHKEIYHADRFKEISLLLIDFGMPGINGQQFCKLIEGLPLQKILLTGEATFENAVEMFNDKIIDRFFKKDSDLLAIFESIKSHQKQYFQLLTKEIVSSLNNSGSTVFSDTKFIEFFDSLCNKNKIVEHYVLDDGGSFLLNDKMGSLKVLIVKSEEDMRVLYEFSEGESDVGASVISDLKEKRKIVFFKSEDDLMVPVKNWVFYDAKTIQGDGQIYTYAIIDADQTLGFDKDKIVSFNQYVRNK